MIQMLTLCACVFLMYFPSLCVREFVSSWERAAEIKSFKNLSSNKEVVWINSVKLINALIVI